MLDFVLMQKTVETAKDVSTVVFSDMFQQ